jgi:hypothetical protein
MAISAFFLSIGFLYRHSAVLFFLSFTYVELVDVSNYLNHYYFVSIISFLLIWMPAGKYLSIDYLIRRTFRKTSIRQVEFIPRWPIFLLRTQLGLVYFFAGLAKLNPDWMLEALPLKIWLKSYSAVPIIGPILFEDTTAYIFSWAGAFFDLTIPIWMSFRKTRIPAYISLVVFHLLTGWMFPIGMFPYIMIISTLIFFSADDHKFFYTKILRLPLKGSSYPAPYKRTKIIVPFIALFLFIQVILPMRYLAYPPNLFWHEQGYRFSWRVMLIEKAGYSTFYVVNSDNGLRDVVENDCFLSLQQEKMMSTQPDLILQFAHILENHYQEHMGWENVEVYVKSYVSLQGRGSRLFIDPNVDLTKQKYDWRPYTWVLPY